MDGDSVAFHRHHDCRGATPETIAWRQGYKEGKKQAKKNAE